MEPYSLLTLKLSMGILGLILQINLMGKGNLAPISAMDQVQNYVLGRHYRWSHLQQRYRIAAIFLGLSTMDSAGIYPAFCKKSQPFYQNHY